MARLRSRRFLTHAAWVVVILAVALTACSLWVAYAPADPSDGRHLNDTQFYYGSAVQLAEGKGYVNPGQELVPLSGLPATLSSWRDCSASSAPTWRSPGAPISSWAH